MHLHNCHCRHILFGCSHDNGYARLLEEVAASPNSNSITLLEGIPFERELQQLKTKYSTTRFDGLFRTSKISDYRQSHIEDPVRQQAGGILSSQSNYQPEANGSAFQSQYQFLSQPSPQPDTAGRQTAASPANGNSANHAASKWATAAKAAPPYVASSPPAIQHMMQASKPILRNKFGQRIDPIVKYDPQELLRLKKLKLCNVHFLRGECQFDPCGHDHYYKPNKNELSILRHISRGIPCRYGTECDDPDCIYGHVCPNSSVGRNDCMFGNTCRFERDQHGIDKTPVKTTKV